MRISLFGGFGLLALLASGCAQPPPPQSVAAVTQPPPPPAFEIHTLRDLVDVCRDAESDPYHASAIGLCWGYASGVLDFYLVDTATGHRHARVCLPPTVPRRDEAVSGLLAWADVNPQALQEPAPAGLMRYYVAEYPCSAAGPGRRRAPPHR